MALRHGKSRGETFFKVQKWSAAFSTWMDIRKKTFGVSPEAAEITIRG